MGGEEMKWEEVKKYIAVQSICRHLTDPLIQAAEEEITDYADKLRLANTHIAEAEEKIAQLIEERDDYKRRLDIWNSGENSRCADQYWKEITRLREWQEFVRYNSKDAAHQADTQLLIKAFKENSDDIYS